MLKELKTNIKKQFNAEKSAYNKNKQGYIVNNLKWAIPVAMMGLALFGTLSPAFASGTTPPSLEIDTEAMTTALFKGANIILGALGAVMFLLAGFKLGGVLIHGIVNTIGGIRF